MENPMPKKLIDYVPKKKKDLETHLVQAKCNRELTEAVTAQREKDGISWVEFFEASMRRYLEESKK